MARAYRGGLAVKLDKSATGFPSNAFCFGYRLSRTSTFEEYQQLTARIASIARQTGLNTLIASLLRSCCPGSRHGTLPLSGASIMQRLFTGVALVDMTRKEITEILVNKNSTGAFVNKRTFSQTDLHSIGTCTVCHRYLKKKNEV